MLEWSEWSGMDVGGFPFLNKLTIAGCDKLNSLPLGPLQSLVTLNLSCCDSLATIPALPCLLEMEREACPSLTFIGSSSSDPILTASERYDCSRLGVCADADSSLPKLTILKIDYCQNLSSVSSLPSLTIMEPRCFPHLSAVSFGTLPSLTILKLKNCRKYQGECDFCSLTTDLKCNNQTGLLYSVLNELPSLESLEIHDMSITQIPLKQQSLPSLTRLRLSNCSELHYCDGLATLTSLEHLEVWNCPYLYLDPPELKTLTIRDTGCTPEDL